MTARHRARTIFPEVAADGHTDRTAPPYRQPAGLYRQGAGQLCPKRHGNVHAASLVESGPRVWRRVASVNTPCNDNRRCEDGVITSCYVETRLLLMTQFRSSVY
jgi:hypothetical protein